MLTLYAAENGVGPMLEVQIDFMSSMSPRGYDQARARLVCRLRELGIPRLQAEDVLTMARPNIPLSHLAGRGIEPPLSVIDDWIAEVSLVRAQPPVSALGVFLVTGQEPPAGIRGEAKQAARRYTFPPRS